VDQELPIHPEHLGSPPDSSGVRVTRSLVICVMFCRSLFAFGHCVVCPSSIYDDDDDDDDDVYCLTPLVTIFQLYHSDQF